MKTLYPACEPYAIHRLTVGGGHEVYVEECGNPRGVPVLFLHGGPGSGCQSEHRRYFDPAFYRIVLFDQRGAGRSLPSGGTSHNSTADLVSDMEQIRLTLGIEQWMLFGGSWGTTLALIYAMAHPDRLLAIVLRGTFLAREADLEWFFIGLRRLFPQAWERFSQGLPACESLQGLIDWYHAAVHSEDRERSLQAARRWSDWGGQIVGWHLPRAADTSDSEPESEAQQSRLLAKVRIETHYARHRYFIGENEILERIASLPALPVSIVHGRYDLTCTLEAAWQLHQTIAGSRLIQVAEAGHLIDEPAMSAALIEETDRMRDLL